jgi:hypothetical protein
MFRRYCIETDRPSKRRIGFANDKRRQIAFGRARNPEAIAFFRGLRNKHESDFRALSHQGLVLVPVLGTKKRNRRWSRFKRARSPI